MKSHKKQIKPRKSKLSRKTKLLRGGAEINLQIGSVIKTNAGPDIGQESKIKDIVITLNTEQSAYSLKPSDFFITSDITPKQISIIRENGKKNSLEDFIYKLNNQNYILVNNQVSNGIEVLEREIDEINLNPGHMRSYSFEIDGKKFSIVRVVNISKNNRNKSIIVINIENSKIRSIPKDTFLEMLKSNEIKVLDESSS